MTPPRPVSGHGDEPAAMAPGRPAGGFGGEPAAMTAPGALADMHGDVVTAMLLQITGHAERLAALDEREAIHFRQLAARLAELTGHLAAVSDRVGSIGAAVDRHAAALESLDDLDQQLAGLAARLTSLRPDGGQDPGSGEPRQPGTAPRWWNPDAAGREDAIDRLRAWVEQVYRPGYGHLAAALGPCWDQHPLCLYGLDWLMELWSVFYLSERKTTILASQAEWQTRLLPALAEQMNLETTRCEHARPGRLRQQSPNARAGSAVIRRPGQAGAP
jgi:hypothetical protein